MQLLLVVSFFVVVCNAQTEWSLKKDKDGIKVYTGKLTDSKFNAIKVSCLLNGSLSSLAAIVLQPELQPEWVMATTSPCAFNRTSISKYKTIVYAWSNWAYY